MTKPPAPGRTAAPWNGTIPRTRLFDALSLLLPAGESFVVDALEAWASASDSLDDRAKAELGRFIREERAHQRAHRLYNEVLVARAPSALAVAQRAERAVAELQRLPLVQRVALAAAFEQLTAVISHEVLAHPHLLAHDEPASSEVRLWRWHAAEELRHCHVATRAAGACGVGLPGRAAAQCMASAYLAFDVLRGWAALCASDMASGAGRLRICADTLAFAIRSVPSLARMTIGWWRCLIFPYAAGRSA